MKLITGTDSTWSIRAWICAQLAQVELEIEVIDLTLPDFKSNILKHSPTGLVPALIDGDIVIHDSLAISEYFNEMACGQLYPDSSTKRALARSLCAEMHSGFFALRTQCPFTLDKVAALNPNSNEIKSEIERLHEIFGSAQLPFMFEKAGIVDAFYAILAYRLKVYGVTLTGKAGDYQHSLLNWSLLTQAIDLAETWRH